MVKKCVLVMLMIMLVVTQVECITPSQEFPPINLEGDKGPACDLKCTVICSSQKRLTFDECMKVCTSRCSVPVKAKTLS